MNKQQILTIKNLEIEINGKIDKIKSLKKGEKFIYFEGLIAESAFYHEKSDNKISEMNQTQLNNYKYDVEKAELMAVLRDFVNNHVYDKKITVVQKRLNKRNQGIYQYIAIGL